MPEFLEPLLQSDHFGIIKIILKIVIGGGISYLFYKVLYGGIKAHTKSGAYGGTEGRVKTYGYSNHTKKVIVSLGLVSLTFAIIPLYIVWTKYYGPSPILPGTRGYRHDEDLLGVSILLLIFGPAAILCLLDPFLFRLKVSEKGVLVRGVFSGERLCPWENIDYVNDYPSIQMLGVKGKTESGKKVTLWIPYHISGLHSFAEQLYAHNVFYKDQLPYTAHTKAHLEKSGITNAVAYKVYSPFLSVWKDRSGPEQYHIVMYGENKSGEDEYSCISLQNPFFDALEKALSAVRDGFLTLSPDSQDYFEAALTEVIAVEKALLSHDRRGSRV
mgnify:CR=1 FL=1